MDKYILIGRSSAEAISIAGKDIVALVQQDNNLLLVESIVLFMMSEVEKGETFDIKAIEEDFETEIEGDKYNITYEVEQQEALSVFNYICSTVNEWNKIYGLNKDLNWKHNPQKATRELNKLLKKAEL